MSVAAQAKTLATFAYILALDSYTGARGLALRARRGASPPEVEDLAGRLRRDGFVIIEDYLRPEEVGQVAAAVGEYLGEDYGDYDHVNKVSYFRRPLPDQVDDGGVFRLFGAHALHPLARRFREDPRLIEIIERAFHTRLRCAATLVQENLPVGTETRDFHLDMYAPREFKAFLFLTDVTEDQHGPYAVLRGSHRWRWRRLANYLARGLRELHPVTSVEDLTPAELGTLVKFRVRRGSVVLSIQQAIHRGWPLRVGKRQAVVNYYYEKLRSREPDFDEGRRLGYRHQGASHG